MNSFGIHLILGCLGYLAMLLILFVLESFVLLLISGIHIANAYY